MKYIAERKLLYSEKNTRTMRDVTIKISEPFVAVQEDVSFLTDGVISGCYVEIEGLDESGYIVYGADSLQAINMASNIEPLLKRLCDKYDFFWATGEPYFEE